MKNFAKKSVLSDKLWLFFTLISMIKLDAQTVSKELSTNSFISFLIVYFI